MQTVSSSIVSSLQRQVNHWMQAASRLSLEHVASGTAWYGIDHRMGVRLKESLQQSIDEINALALSVKKQLDVAADAESFRAVRRAVLQLKDRYLRAEETIHFYVVAINSRTTPNLAALLRGCDIVCEKSMQELLRPLGKETPEVLTYIDKGVGASILKAGLRLWDGKLSAVAAIKVTQHNLFRPTAIIHETGHQIAHILEWNEEISTVLTNELSNHPKVVAAAFSGWSSEMSADAFAFVHTGYASVAALHDVVSGSTASVLAYHMFDPHPISYVRVLLNIEMCKQFYGRGAWDEMEETFKHDYDLDQVNMPSVDLIKMCVVALPDVARLLLKHPYRAFGNKSLAQLIPPDRASPHELQKLEYLAGSALFTSHAWIWKECIRLLALNGYKIGIGKGDLAALYKQQEEWMVKLGFSVELN